MKIMLTPLPRKDIGTTTGRGRVPRKATQAALAFNEIFESLRERDKYLNDHAVELLKHLPLTTKSSAATLTLLVE